MYLKWLPGKDTEKWKMMKLAGKLEDKYQYIIMLREILSQAGNWKTHTHKQKTTIKTKQKYSW